MTVLHPAAVTSEGRHLDQLPNNIAHAYVRERARSLSKGSADDQNGSIASRLDIISIAALKYDVDPVMGFAPADEPIQRLDGPGEAWEAAWDASAGLRLYATDGRGGQWRKEVEAMPVQRDLSFLSSMQHLRRARAVLAFLAHRYSFSLPEAVDPAYIPTVPDSIAVPLVEISRQLDMPPVLTYADSGLYNWRYRDPSAGFRLDNLEVTSSFTQTRSESHFYLIPLAIEVEGAPALKLMSLMLDEVEAPTPATPAKLTAHLDSLAQIMDRCTAVLGKMYDDCDPATFFYEIRPWFNGGKRWLAGDLVDWGGPSAGQSSMVHAFDCILGVDHLPEPGQGHGQFEATFMQRMAAYMPAPHRAFLRHLAREAPSLRTYAADRPDDVGAAYDRCVDALRRLRESHMRIVWTYIVAFVKSKKGATVADDQGEEGPKGTGGTDLVQFLKLTRERTMETRLSPR